MNIFTKKIIQLNDDEINNIPVKKIFKGAMLLSLAPIMILSLLVLNNLIDMSVGFSSGLLIFCISYMFIRPYILNLSNLTSYVRSLSKNEDIAAPDLTYLNNVEELTEAVSDLHKSWQMRNNKLEALVEEGDILIDIIPDILIMFDKNSNIIKINEIARAAFGGSSFKLARQEILKNNDIKMLYKQTIKDIKTSDAIYSPPDSNKYYLVRCEKFPENSPSKIAVIIAMHDVTKLKKTEKMLSDFVANASHEMRTPLTSIKGFIETLQTSAKDDEPARIKFLKVMSAQTDRMSNLIDKLLSLSEIEENKSIPKNKIDIKLVIRNILPQFKVLAKEKNMRIIVNDKQRLSKIKVEENDINQLLDNLLSNAIKYGYSKSNINIELKLVDNIHNIKNAEKLLSIAIKNKGIGIEKKDISRLTERFYRVDSARTRKVGGTGLGLSIVSDIVKRYDGVMLVESEMGKSTVFNVLLPVN